MNNAIIPGGGYLVVNLTKSMALTKYTAIKYLLG
jgi:hypothetical protein